MALTSYQERLLAHREERVVDALEVAEQTWAFDRLVHDHLRMARATAARTTNTWNWHDREDLVAEGVVGLVQAARTWQPDRRAQFSSYAKRRVRGAVLDSLRAMDPLTRRQRREVREGRAAAPVRPASLDAVPEHDLRPTPHPGGFTRNPLWVKVVAVFPRLRPLERKVLVLTFERGLTLREVGHELSMTESGACRARARAIEKLRALLIEELRDAT